MMKQAIHMTHNRLVAGSSPEGTTRIYLLNQGIKPLLTEWLFCLYGGHWQQSSQPAKQATTS